MFLLPCFEMVVKAFVVGGACGETARLCSPRMGRRRGGGREGGERGWVRGESLNAGLLGKERSRVLWALVACVCSCP